MDGTELIRVFNELNIRQERFGSVNELAQYIKDQNIDIELLKIALLSDIKSRLIGLESLHDLIMETNKYLKKIYNPE